MKVICESKKNGVCQDKYCAHARPHKKEEETEGKYCTEYSKCVQTKKDERCVNAE